MDGILRRRRRDVQDLENMFAILKRLNAKKLRARVITETEVAGKKAMIAACDKCIEAGELYLQMQAKVVEAKITYDAEKNLRRLRISAEGKLWEQEWLKKLPDSSRFLLEESRKEKLRLRAKARADHSAMLNKVAAAEGSASRSENDDDPDLVDYSPESETDEPAEYVEEMDEDFKVMHDLEDKKVKTIVEVSDVESTTVTIPYYASGLVAVKLETLIKTENEVSDLKVTGSMTQQGEGEDLDQSMCLGESAFSGASIDKFGDHSLGQERVMASSIRVRKGEEQLWKILDTSILMQD